MNVLPGLEVLIDEEPWRIQGKRIGLVTNQSAVTRDLRHAVKLLQAGRGWKLTALFGPEHGIWGEAQDMAHIDHSTDPLTGLPVSGPRQEERGRRNGETGIGRRTP